MVILSIRLRVLRVYFPKETYDKELVTLWENFGSPNTKEKLITPRRTRAIMPTAQIYFPLLFFYPACLDWIKLGHRVGVFIVWISLLISPFEINDFYLLTGFPIRRMLVKSQFSAPCRLYVVYKKLHYTNSVSCFLEGHVILSLTENKLLLRPVHKSGVDSCL